MITSIEIDDGSSRPGKKGGTKLGLKATNQPTNILTNIPDGVKLSLLEITE